MRLYELSFATPELQGPDDPRFDELLEQVDAVFATHSGLTSTTVVMEGSSAVSAAQRAVELMTQCAIVTHRVVPDLVDRAEIAERAGVSRQAVGNWVRGERRAERSFPAPYAGEVWMWGDVVPWLRSHGYFEDPAAYPTTREHVLIESWLLRQRRHTSAAAAWMAVADWSSAVTVSHYPQPHGRSVRDTDWEIQCSYALAAGE